MYCLAYIFVLLGGERCFYTMEHIQQMHIELNAVLICIRTLASNSFALGPEYSQVTSEKMKIPGSNQFLKDASLLHVSLYCSCQGQILC